MSQLIAGIMYKKRVLIRSSAKSSVMLSAALSVMLFTSQARADDHDAVLLSAEVSEQVELISRSGLLPTTLEIEVITGDVVTQQLLGSDIAVDGMTAAIEQAIVQYQLTPTVARYVKIKVARLTAQNYASGGHGQEPPQ
jgi:hypothetical protein